MNADLERLKTLAPKRLLVADDDAVLIRLFDLFLRPSGLEVENVSDGHELLTAALRHPPDIILTDVVMPVMEGLEVVTRLRKHLPSANQNLPILVISAHVGREEALAAGATDHLPKPVSTEDLYHMLASNLAGVA